MKVLQFVADGAPGGGTNHVLQLLRSLSHGCELILLTQEDSYLHKEAEKLGIPVITGDFFRSRLDPAAIRLVSETIRQNEPHLVHCHGGRAAFFRSFVADSTPSLYTVHDFTSPENTGSPRSLAGSASSGRSAACSKSSSSANSTASWLSELSCSRYINRIASSTTASPHRRVEPGESTEKLGVGFIGRMVYQKNPQLFVEVLDRLPNVDAVMVGGGDLESEVAQLIESRGLADRVKLYGSLGHKDALNVLSKLDVLLMTPRWEGLPRLPLEAMFLRVPVVSTSGGGIPEVIEHGRTGMLVDDADELATHVNHVLQEDSLRKQIIENASRKAIDQLERKSCSEVFVKRTKHLQDHEGSRPRHFFHRSSSHFGRLAIRPDQQTSLHPHERKTHFARNNIWASLQLAVC